MWILNFDLRNKYSISINDVDRYKKKIDRPVKNKRWQINQLCSSDYNPHKIDSYSDKVVLCRKVLSNFYYCRKLVHLQLIIYNVANNKIFFW